MTAPKASAVLLPAVGLVAAAALAAEVLYMRLLAIVHWQQFAYMIISLALLGYGVSGTVLTLTRERWLRRPGLGFGASAAGLAVTIPGCFWLAQLMPFNGLAIVWDGTQLLWLAALYLLLAVPFFFAANCIALALMAVPGRIRGIYLSDLLGAGLGTVAVIVLLAVLPGERALLALAGVAAVGGVLGWLAWRSDTAGLSSRLAAWGSVLALALTLAWTLGWPALSISPYKDLAKAREVMGAEVIGERYSPVGRLTLLRSPQVPLRHAPGLSLHAEAEPPAQIGVFIDGGAMTPIVRHERGQRPPAYLDAMPSALPYNLLEQPGEVAVLGAGGGASVLQALYHDARKIEAIELNPELIELLRGPYRQFSGALYDDPRVTVTVAEARAAMARSHRQYDLVQIAMLESFGAVAAGTQSLAEGYTYTVEALTDYLRRLRPDGVLAMTRWIKVPPRHSLKLVATAIRAQQRLGVAAPRRNMAMIRSWNTATLLVKRRPFTQTQLQRLRSFAEERGFDLVHYAGMRRTEANRFNVWSEPYLFDGVQALLGDDPEAFIERYKFDIRPATDDRPYFHNVFRWRLLPELARMGRQAGPLLMESGYLILAATLAQAVLAGFGLILLPLVLARRGRGPWAARRHWTATGVYFGAIGLGFLFVEIAFIQKLELFLGHPLYAVSIALGGFLIFAGLGSGLAERLLSRWVAAGARRVSVVAVAVLTVLLLAYLVGLPGLLSLLMGWPTPARMAVALAIVAPAAFLMGLMFPLGLRRLAATAPELVPWAWGVNGCASVISAVLATVLALHWGFTAVVLAALALYWLACWAVEPLGEPSGAAQEDAGAATVSAG